MSASLTSEIARILGVDPGAAETELKEYVQFLAREIQTKGKVEIGEVGTFFNSATGLQFTPHDALAKLVNREYAGLDPVVLEATDVKPGYRRNEVINTGDGEDADLPVEHPPHVDAPPSVAEEAPPVAAQAPETPPRLELEPESMHDLTAMLHTEPDPAPAPPPRTWPEEGSPVDPAPFSYQSMEEIIDSVESGSYGQEDTPREPDPLTRTMPEFFEQPLTVPGNLTDAVEDPYVPPVPEPEPAPEPVSRWEDTLPAGGPESDGAVSPEEFLASLTEADVDVPRPAPAAPPYEPPYEAEPPAFPQSAEPPAFPQSADPPAMADPFQPFQEQAAQPFWGESDPVQDSAPPSWANPDPAPPAQPNAYSPPFSATAERPVRRPGSPSKDDAMRKYAIWGILGVIGLVALFGLGRFLLTSTDEAPLPEANETVLPVDPETVPPAAATEPAPADALETETPVEAAPLGDYALVIGSYPTRAEAEAVASNYTSTPLVVEITPARIRGAQWYRVALGSYATIDDAVRGKRELPPGLEDAWVSKVR